MTSPAGEMFKEEYLGDGLYVSFDGFQVWLRAPRDHGDHYVALEPLVLSEFLRFLHQNQIIGKKKTEE